MSSLISTLDNYWLYKEIYTKLNLTPPAYKSWGDTNHLKLNRYLFIQKETLPDRYSYIEESLTDISGFLPTQYAASQLNVDSHIFSYKKMRLYNNFEYRYIDGIKFVNLKRFFSEHNIKISQNSTINLGRLDDIIITPNSRFYAIDSDYGVVVYD